MFCGCHKRSRTQTVNFGCYLVLLCIYLGALRLHVALVKECGTAARTHIQTGCSCLPYRNYFYIHEFTFKHPLGVLTSIDAVCWPHLNENTLGATYFHVSVITGSQQNLQQSSAHECCTNKHQQAWGVEEKAGCKHASKGKKS